MGLAFLEKLSSQFWVGEMHNVRESMPGGECFKIWFVENCLRFAEWFLGFVSPVVG